VSVSAFAQQFESFDTAASAFGSLSVTLKKAKNKPAANLTQF
jgi:hypothetical protein